MAAAMGRQHTHTGHFEQCVPILIPKVAGVDGLSGNRAFPHEFSGLFPEKYSAGLDVGRHRYVPDAGGTLGRADVWFALHHVYRLPDVNTGTVRLDVLGFQGEDFLCPHSRCQHEPDRVPRPVLGQALHQLLHFLLGECLLTLHRPLCFHLLRKADGIFTDEVIGLGLVHDLIEHSSAFCQAGKGKPTWYGQIRRNVDACIARSFLFEHFLANLKRQGYAVKTGKYIAVRPPGKERFVRLKTLEDDYTEEAIRERIRAHEPPPRRSAPRTAPKRSYKIQHKPRKLTGFRALYFHYLYLLGKLKKPTASPRRRRYMTDEIIKFDRYVEQGRLLIKYRIDTWEQLSMLEEAIQSELDALCGQRKGLYTARRKKPTGTDLSPAILSINQSTKILRRELKVCGRIEADGPAIRQKLLEPLPTPPKLERAPRQRPRKRQR